MTHMWHRICEPATGIRRLTILDPTGFAHNGLTLDCYAREGRERVLLLAQVLTQLVGVYRLPDSVWTAPPPSKLCECILPVAPNCASDQSFARDGLWRRRSLAGRMWRSYRRSLDQRHEQKSTPATTAGHHS